MRNTEAARYARWSARIAVLIVLVVAGVYAQRAIREARARRVAPPPVPAAVQQRSAEFSFSKVEKDRTLFTVRASHAIEFKDRDRSLLQDVWITVYGREGSRNDNIHTRECSYEPSSGRIRCRGAVQIELASAAQGRRGPASGAAEIETRDVSFDRDPGVVSTNQPVKFRFPYGEGSGVGLQYETKRAIVRLEGNVRMNLFRPGQAGAAGVELRGRSLEYRADARAIELLGPAHARQGNRELTAGAVLLDLDPQYRVRRALASGNPQIGGGAQEHSFSVSAHEFQMDLNAAGGIENVSASGGVHGVEQGPRGGTTFVAQRVDLKVEPGTNQPREMVARGDVGLESHRGQSAQKLQTSALRLEFHLGSGGDAGRLAKGETLAPGLLESARGDESLRVRAERFGAEFGPQNRLEKFLGRSGVQINRRIGAAPSQVATARELELRFGADGEWKFATVTGDVCFRQQDRTAQAARGEMDRVTGRLALEGSPVVSDGQSRTTAARIEFNQRTGDVKASGGVRTTYLAAGGRGAPELGAGPAEISADSLAASNRSGVAVYSGHARLWQGDAVMDADTIVVRRSPQTLEARGDVVALFPEIRSSGTKETPRTIWTIRAPHLVFSNEEGRAALEGGVQARSPKGELAAQALDLFLGRSASGQRRLTRAVARGSVEIRQGERRATSEQADYFASEGKFVLTGGRPTLVNASRDTTTGHSLTFFLANDTILVDSQVGSRTLTKHRIEK